MIGQDKSDKEFFDEAKHLLSERRDETIEDASARVDVLLAQRSRPLILGEDEDAVVRVVPRTVKVSGTHEIRWDSASQRVIVDVSPELFAPRRMLFLGETYEVFFVAKKNSDSGVSINVKKNAIYVNAFNGELSHFGISILDVYIALEVADAVSKTKADLKRNFLRLLGAAPSKAAPYVTRLGDDLRRSTVYKA